MRRRRLACFAPAVESAIGSRFCSNRRPGIYIVSAR